MQWVFLWTDSLLYGLILGAIVIAILSCKQAHLRRPWQEVGKSRGAMISLVIFLTFVALGLLDSFHFKQSLSGHTNTTKKVIQRPEFSALDWLVFPLGTQLEKSYSAPFATHLTAAYVYKHGQLASNDLSAHRLRYSGRHRDDLLSHAQSDDLAVLKDVMQIAIKKTLWAIGLWCLLVLVLTLYAAHRHTIPWCLYIKKVFTGKTLLAVQPFLYTTLVMMILLITSFSLAHYYHILGTDKVGQDVFYQAIKSIRTGLLIGSLSLLFMLPFALLLGVIAGYFSGWVDDIVQYIYTLLSSVPSILLIIAAVLSLQTVMVKYARTFDSQLVRADARLLLLCAILGATNWTPLCRLLRGATLKLKTVEFVETAKAMGVSHSGILFRHIIPNLLPLVLITLAMEFSSLVLLEAILSYIGVGVDPSTLSWGNMINGARLELANSPVIWWPLTAAFVFMFALTLSANLFADAVREAFNPKGKDYA